MALSFCLKKFKRNTLSLKFTYWGYCEMIFCPQLSVTSFKLLTVIKLIISHNEIDPESPIQNLALKVMIYIFAK